MDVLVRAYVPGDYPAARRLWVELTGHHRLLYDDPTIGGDDPGTGFEDYLATPTRVGSWVADLDGEVVGLTGLLDHGHNGEIEPVVVATARRGRHIGQALIEYVVAEARRRNFEYLAIRPVARNLTAIRSFYQAGFQTLGGHVDLTIDLQDRRHRWIDGANLHGLDFRY